VSKRDKHQSALTLYGSALQRAVLRKSVVILDSLFIVRRSALPRRDDLRTWFRATELHWRVRSRRLVLEQTAR
jgi:hypothetical protein